MSMTASRLGYRFGIAAGAATIAYDVVQLAQMAGILHFPADEILIYGTSLCIVVPLVLEMVALHQLTRGEQRVWTLAALMFTGLYAVFVTTNYVVQLATVVPAKIRGTLDAVRLLDQTPHSLMWDFDAMGYISLGIACAFAVPALSRVGVERWARRALLANALVTPLIATVYFAPSYSNRLLLLGLPWAVTAPLFMLTLAAALSRKASAAVPSTLSEVAS
jgi:hypothetical protein